MFMTVPIGRRIYRAVLSTVVVLCLFEALGEWFFTIPFRQSYFPAQVDRFEWLRVVCFLVVALFCFVEGCSLFIYRRFTPAI